MGMLTYHSPNGLYDTKYLIDLKLDLLRQAYFYYRSTLDAKFDVFNAV